MEDRLFFVNSRIYLVSGIWDLESGIRNRNKINPVHSDYLY